MREAINFVWQLSLFAELVVAVRLLQQGLAGEYPALLTASCVLPIKSLLLMASYVHSAPHVQMRLVARNLVPIEWIAYSWIVFELFARWTNSYNGIRRFGKFLLAALLVTALLISGALWHVEWEALISVGDYRIYYIISRVVLGTLAVFIVGTWLFFRNYPVAIAPNVVRHTYICAVYFCGSALCELAFTMNGLKVVAFVNLTLVVIAAGCSFAWALLLTRKGQVKSEVQKVTPQDRDRIERINEELLVFMGNFPKGR